MSTRRDRASGLRGLDRSARRVGHFLLGSQDAAPFFVLGDGHSAFHADTDPLNRAGLTEKQLLQDAHHRLRVSRTGGACAPGPTMSICCETEKPARRFATN